VDVLENMSKGGFKQAVFGVYRQEKFMSWIVWMGVCGLFKQPIRCLKVFFTVLNRCLPTFNFDINTLFFNQKWMILKIF
jgi:hypothetical protein